MSCMITGSWQAITLLCGCHPGEKTVMQLQENKTISYVCPKFQQENRGEGESPCLNRIDMKDYEKMLDHIATMLVEAEISDRVLNIAHHKWKTRNGIEFEILEQTVDGNYTVKAINHKSLTGY